jgi:hypothetical protein
MQGEGMCVRPREGSAYCASSTRLRAEHCQGRLQVRLAFLVSNSKMSAGASVQAYQYRGNLPSTFAAIQFTEFLEEMLGACNVAGCV